MAFYTTYTQTVLFTTSAGITNSKFSNVIASMLADITGGSVSKTADEAANSTASNYAAVTISGLEIRIYGVYTNTIGGLYFYLYYPNGVSWGSQNINLLNVANVSETASFRVYNTKSGFFIAVLTSTSVYQFLFAGMLLKRISDDVAFLGIYMVDVVGINDGLNSIKNYFIGANTNRYDAGGQKQMLYKALISQISSSNYAATYIADDFYTSALILNSGIFSVAGRYFAYPYSWIPIIPELNP